MNLTPIYDPPEQPKPHPICLLMPSADEDELQSLTDDIRAHGLLDPIVLFEKRILDGRNRAAACESAGRGRRMARVMARHCGRNFGQVFQAAKALGLIEIDEFDPEADF
jgi:hypothetical protein